MKSSKDVHSLFSLGLGSVAASTVVTTKLPTYGIRAIVANSLFANSPQIIFSFLYYTYNMLMTAAISASEWDQFSLRRKGLRVSGAHHQRESAQRSTYFLQLPYRYGIPLVTLSAVLHWLISQSIFPLSVDIYDRTGTLWEISNPDFESNVYIAGQGSSVTCGWSPVAVVAVIVLGSCMVLGLFVVGMKRLSGEMPVAGSCSAAIASACHSHHEPNAWTMELKWGVVEDATAEKPGHLAFSSKTVGSPQVGSLYAGDG